MGFTQIVFRNTAHSSTIGERIREMSRALGERYSRIQRCRVVVEELQAPGAARDFKVTAEVRVAERMLSASSQGANIDAVLQGVFADLREKLLAISTHSWAA